MANGGQEQQARYIFVTGGVASSVGKGITVAAIGRLLKSRGLRVAVQKLDPYLNVDPGTMSPYQHGEVFVTDDGAETDLDLGHYERFIDIRLTRDSNVTMGQVYSAVIQKERRGDFLGGTIQTVPHVTNEIKERIRTVTDIHRPDVLIVEVGGTVGDIEGQPCLEAIRQLRRDAGRDNVLYIHVTLLPYLGSTGELKTKPTQHSVHELRRIGIQPDVIILRSDWAVPDDVKEKVALFGDVDPRGVIPLLTADTIYEVPLILEEAGLGEFVVEQLRLPSAGPALEDWRDMVERVKSEHPTLKIALVGKYTELRDSYISISEALTHAGLANNRAIDIDWINSEAIEELSQEEVDHLLRSVSGVLVAPGFGARGVEGKIKAARFAREQQIPYLGICYGMQMACIEIARHVCGLADAHSTEINPEAAHPIIDIMPDQRDLADKGGTMRLGHYPCQVASGTRAYAAYGQEQIQERHRHRFEFNNAYRGVLERAGMVFSGLSPDGRLVEIVELENHPWFVGTQFHPEFLSRPMRPHPLFRDFIQAAALVLHEGDQPPLPLDQGLVVAQGAVRPGDEVFHNR